MEKSTHQQNVDALPLYETIAAASAGDCEAIRTIIRHYAGFLNQLSVREFTDENGNSYFRFDPDLRELLEITVMSVLLRFNPYTII